MVRWTYLIPRIVIISLIVLAVWVGSDPLVRRVVLSKMQDATGAKIELGNLRYSFSNQKIFLKDIAIADARLPTRNLLQAEMAYVELDSKSLLRRQIAIERGETSMVVFGSPRTESGVLPGFPASGEMEEFQWNPKQFEPIESIGVEWLDQFPIRDNRLPSGEELELVQAARELAKFWKSQLQRQSKQVTSLQQKRSKLAVDTADDGNPLRKGLVNARTEFAALALESRTLNSSLIELERIAHSHQQQLSESFNRDVQKLRQSIHPITFDSESVSKLLLTKFQEERISDIVGWFHWFRSVIPDPQSDFQSKRKRGVDIRLPGIEQVPGFLIKSIDLEGEGRFANRHFNFAGTAYDLTNEPSLHDKPISFEFRAQGDQHLIVNCTLDRRSELPVDTLKVVCPDMMLTEQLFGEENSMLVTMGPASQIQADIQITTTGDQLTGELVFRHSNVSLHVDKLHDMIGGSNTALQMNQGLASVDQFQSTVKLSGTLEDYQYSFESDLGSRFAHAANDLLATKTEQTFERGKTELQDLLKLEMSKLENEIMPEIQRLVQLLEQETVEIASRLDQQSQNQGRLRKLH